MKNCERTFILPKKYEEKWEENFCRISFFILFGDKSMNFRINEIFHNKIWELDRI